MKFNLVATGGTFDRFHKGHAALLEKAFEVSEKVIIGVTSDWMVSREPRILREIVLPYDKRVSDLKAYLAEKGFLGREIIEKLNDVYGPTVVNGEVAAVVCTRETRNGAVAINRERGKHGKRRLEVIECPFITSLDRFHISSTRIRLGQINREGQILSRQKFGLLLPDYLRAALAKPIGTLYPDIVSALKNPESVILISVGDMVYQKLILQGINPSIAIIDLQIGRKKLTISSPASQGQALRGWGGRFDYVVKNKAGTVSATMIQTLKKAVKQYLSTKKNIVIKVIGEEDLAVIPAILVVPLQSVILYGQPALTASKRCLAGQPPANGEKGGPARNATSIPASNALPEAAASLQAGSRSDAGWAVAGGVVRVEVTEEKKRWAVELLRKFI